MTRFSPLPRRKTRASISHGMRPDAIWCFRISPPARSAVAFEGRVLRWDASISGVAIITIGFEFPRECPMRFARGRGHDIVRLRDLFTEGRFWWGSRSPPAMSLFSIRAVWDIDLAFRLRRAESYFGRGLGLFANYRAERYYLMMFAHRGDCHTRLQCRGIHRDFSMPVVFAYWFIAPVIYARRSRFCLFW